MRFVVATVVALLGACASNERDDWDSVVEVGDIGLVDDPPVQAPATAKVGVDVTVMITTAGGGCISFESTEVAGLDITPYDRRLIPPPHGGCTAILVQIPHNAVMRFDTAGAHTLRVHVRRNGAPTEITAVVDVQP